MPVAPSLRSHRDDASERVVVDSARHPTIRRVSDVLRSRATTPRTLLLDDGDSIEQAVLAGVRVEAIYSTPGCEPDATRLYALAPSAERVVVAEEVMRQLAPRDHSARVLALVRAPRPAHWDAFSRAAGDVLVLDGVRITGNIGAIVRSARALGAGGVLLVDSGLTTAYDRRLIRASRGLVFTLPTMIAERDRVISYLKAERMPLLALTADAAAPLEHIRRHAGRAAILMGSERFGASRELDAVTSERYAVPMAEGVESLNVSVAAALALYERRQGRHAR